MMNNEILEKKIQDNMDILSNKYSFDFGFVNLKNIEKSIDEKDQGFLSLFSDFEKDYYEKIKLRKNKIQSKIQLFSR